VKWIVPIMGFTEAMDRRTGMERLWSMMRPLGGPNVTVLMPWEWRDDMRALAEFIARNSAGSAPRVFAVAYSWGAGYAFPRFARCCEQLGIPIDVACLCDPVYRSGLLPWWLPVNPLSLLRGRRIKIPASVASVFWVRQMQFPPCGHDLVPVDPEETDIAPAKVLNVPHSRIDDSPAWRAMVMDLAISWVRDRADGTDRTNRDLSLAS
jgi:hypothetical protein